MPPAGHTSPRSHAGLSGALMNTLRANPSKGGDAKPWVYRREGAYDRQVAVLEANWENASEVWLRRLEEAVA